MGATIITPELAAERAVELERIEADLERLNAARSRRSLTKEERQEVLTLLTQQAQCLGLYD